MAEKDQQKREISRRANRVVLWRTIILMCLFGVLVFIPLLVKLWNIQITRHEYYQELAIDQQTGELSVSANRGTIYDAKGNILSISATVHNVVVSPNDVVELQKNYDKAVEDAKEKGTALPDYAKPTNERIAAGLAAILDADEEMILDRLSRTGRRYEVISYRIEDDLADRVRAFISENHLANGVFLEPTSKRYYPNSSLASHIVGFVNSDGEGAYGLEAKYNSELTGEAGRVVTAKNARGTQMFTRYEKYISSRDGADMHLTIDANIQSRLESALIEGIEAWDVQNGAFGIVMNPNTGAVYAMASYPDYDLNDAWAIADPNAAAALEAMLEDPEVTNEDYNAALVQARWDQWRSKALNDTYEPGSTFKALVLAAALEEGVVSESDTFYCPGYYVVNGQEISCSKLDGHKDQTLAKAVANSCNPAFMMIGQRLGAEKFYDYLERYNLLSTTGFDVPGEGGSVIWDRGYFTTAEGYLSLATASFGQGFNVTSLQIISGVAATINGGHLLQPYVVESMVADDGSVIYQHQTTEVRQVISEATSERVRAMLEGVVDGGTGKNAYQAGYRIGGKTGTSETFKNGERDPDRNIVSFVGFAPANDPQVIVLLAYDGPKPAYTNSNYTASGVYISGGNMTATMAGPLIADICDYLGIQKQYSADELSGADTAVPSLVGHYADYAGTLLKQAGFTWRTVGEGDVVTGQIPTAGAYIPGGSEVVLYLSEAVPTDQVEVPDVVGMTPDEARSALTKAGLYIKATGAVDYYTASNKAVNQSVEAGALVNRGTVVEVQFVDSHIQDYG